MTHGWRVIAELPTVPSLPRCGNYYHAMSNSVIDCLFQRLFPFGGRLCEAKAQVNYSYACAPMHSMIAAASSKGVARGMYSGPEVVSAKMGRSRSVQ